MPERAYIRGMELGLYVLVGGALYFLPSFLGSEKENRRAIFLLNLLLGWSFIGWVVALVWAVKKDEAPTRVVVEHRQEAPAPAALPIDPQARVNRLRDLRDRGLLTNDQFFEEVNRL